MSWRTAGSAVPLPSLPRKYLRHTGVLDADGGVLDAPQTEQCHHIHWLLGGMATGHHVNHLPPVHPVGSIMPSRSRSTAFAWAVSLLIALLPAHGPGLYSPHSPQTPLTS